MLPQVNGVFSLWKATGDEMGKKHIFSSVYQARAVRTRANMGPSRTLELNDLRVGIAVGAYEMFSESGLEIKSRSPYPYTMVMTSNSGYIPSKRAFANRYYESHTGFFAEGTAEKLVDSYIKLLEKSSKPTRAGRTFSRPEIIL